MNVNQFYQKGKSAHPIQNRFIANGICLLLLFVQCITSSTAQQPQQQKPALDTASLGSWPTLNANAVSNDGEYVSYTISQKGKPSELCIQSMVTAWKIIIPFGRQFQFIDENQQAVFIKGNDTLCVFNLRNKTAENITGVNGYEIIRCKGRPYLAVGTNKKELLLRNLLTGKENQFNEVTDYQVSKDGKKIAITCIDSGQQRIDWFNFEDSTLHTVWKGKGADGVTFDSKSLYLAFIVKEVIKDQEANSIYHYDRKKDHLLKLWDNARPGFEDVRVLVPGFRFSAEGDRIFFAGIRKVKDKPNTGVNVNVWHYRDVYLQSQQLLQLSNRQLKRPVEMLFSMNIKKNQVTQVTNEGEVVVSIDGDDKFIAVVNDVGNEVEAQWMPLSRQSVYLVSLQTGQRRTVRENSAVRLNNMAISPEGKYFLYFDPEKQNYFSMVVATGEILNLTGKLKEHWGSYIEEKEAQEGRYIAGKCGWVKNEPCILINGRYNLWKVDVSGKNMPVNLTSYVNLDENIVFSPAFQAEYYNAKEIILLAFNRKNKQQGFYYLNLTGKGQIVKLNMNDYLYDYTYMPYRKMSKTSSTNEKYYVVKRGNAKNFPNLFLTNDFKDFQQMTTLHPENDYNWLSAELHTFRSVDSTDIQGILYKPENFDSSKKYPLIFLFYETLSDNLNKYPTAEHSTGAINVSYLISNGYIVFLPDVSFKKSGMVGMSFYNSVMGAVQYLERMPFVNASRMGLQGHSFGAFGVNYIITHTNKFAAALSASGGNNVINTNGNIWEATGNPQMNNTQYRFNETLWERPDLYFENSPILFADKITTPVLILANKGDKPVPYTEGRGMFLSLRRLLRPAWMLEYDNEGHSLQNEQNIKDYEYRVLQFFNHYLKGGPAPVWLATGVPAIEKGINSALDY